MKDLTGQQLADEYMASAKQYIEEGGDIITLLGALKGTVLMVECAIASGFKSDMEKKKENVNDRL